MKRALLAGLGFVALTFAQPALAADAPLPRKTIAPAAAPLFNWTGFYIGLQAGYGFGTSIQTFNAGTTARYNIDGWLAGGTIGYNWQVQQWVLGLEADIAWANINGIGASSATYNCGTICATNVAALGTLRGRLGFAINNFLLYGTVGLAYARIDSNLNGGTASNWRAGLAAGVGLEFLLGPNWSAKLEWLYVDINSFVWTNVNNAFYTCAGIACSTDARFSVIRAGLNLRF
jgi:outer membrane immunogenic protein